MHRPSTDLRHDTRGLATVEYVVILMLVAIAGFSAWQGFGVTVAGRVGLSAEAIAGINPTGSTASGGGGATDGFAASGLTPGAGREGADVTDAGETNVWDEGGVLGRGDATGVEAAARALVDVGADAVVGTLGAVNEAGWWLWDKVTSPLETSAAISAAVTHAVKHPIETGRAALKTAAKVGDGINKAVVDGVRACMGGDSYSCTRAGGTLVSTVIPGSAASTVLRGGKKVASNVARTTNTTSRFGWAHATPESIKSYRDAPVGQRFYGLLNTKTGEVHFRPSEVVNANRANLPAGTAGHMSLGDMVGLPRGGDALGFSVTKTADGPTATYRSSYNMLHPDDALRASDVGMRLQPSRHVERALRELREQGQNHPIGVSPDGW